MANQVDVLEEQLRRVEDREHLIVEAADNQQQRRPQNEMWWQHIIGLHGDKDTLFRSVGIERAVFLDSLTLVHNVHWDACGRRGVIRSTRERETLRANRACYKRRRLRLSLGCELLIDCLRMVSYCLGEILCFLKKSAIYRSNTSCQEKKRLACYLRNKGETRPFWKKHRLLTQNTRYYLWLSFLLVKTHFYYCQMVYR